MLNRVTSGPSLKAAYTWLADGAKLRVSDAAGNGFHYLGSLTYRQDNGGLHLETAAFGDGVIRPTVNGGQEVHYFLCDHLGSVRAIVDAEGEAIERNDYYPFGSPRTVAGSGVTSNRFKYNGKELQTTGNLGFLDYGARMYDAELGRWSNTDPLAEKYYNQSSYTYCGNNPVVLVDPNGMDYWSTSDPSLIAAFFNSLKSGSSTHNFESWKHASDFEFLENLTYNDEKHKYYYFDTGVIDDIVTVVGKSFDANIVPIVETFGYQGAFVHEPVSGLWGTLGYYTGFSGTDKYFDGIGIWNVNVAGRITGIAPVIGYAPTPGMKGGGKYLKGLGRVGKDFHKATKGGTSIKNSILKAIGKNKYEKFVGANPNIIKGKDGYLSLEGTGPFNGKVYKTGLLFDDFFN